MALMGGGGMTTCTTVRRYLPSVVVNPKAQVDSLWPPEVLGLEIVFKFLYNRRRQAPER